MNTVSMLNHVAEQWWVYVLHATWQAALVAAVALAIVYALPRMPAPWRYAILLVALVKFAIPPIMPDKVGRWGLFTWVGPAVVQSPDTSRDRQGAVGTTHLISRDPRLSTESTLSKPASPAQFQADTSSSQTLPAAVESPRPVGAPTTPLRSRLVLAIASVSWKSWLMIGHAMGVLAIIVWIVRGFSRLVALTRRAEKLTPHASSPRSQALHVRLAALSRQLEVKEDADLLITDEPVPPITFWLLRPKVVLPRSIVERLSPAELDTILAHELVHHRRNDWAANWLSLLVTAAWWFNPFAWLLGHAMRNVREECCDDALLSEGHAQPRDYCRALLAAAEQVATSPPVRFTLGFAERPHPVAARMKRIMNPALKRVPKLSGPALVATALLCIAVLPGLRTGAEQRLSTAPPPRPLPDVMKVIVLEEESGVPIEGATIGVPAPGVAPATTNKQGVAEIRYDAQIHAHFDIRVRADGYVPRGMFFNSSPNRVPPPASFTLKLERGTTVGGMVVDAGGQPVEGANVELMFFIQSLNEPFIAAGQDAKSIKTDASGRWRYDLMPRELANFGVAVTHPQYPYTRIWTLDIARLRAQSATFILHRGATLEGIVLDEVGQPIEGGTIFVGQNFHFNSDEIRAEIDEGGRFKIERVPVGQRAVVTAYAPGRSPEMRQLLPTAAPNAPIEFRLDRGQVVEGIVLDPDGKPIAGAEVLSREWRGNETLNLRVSTDADGRFRWDSAPQDEFTVSVTKQGFATGWSQTLRPGKLDHQIVLYPAVRMRGSVVDAESGQPIQSFMVIPGASSKDSGAQIFWGHYRAGHNATGGKYEVVQDWILGSRQYYVRIEAEGYAPAVSRAVGREEGEVEINFQLGRAEALKGIVTHPNGQPGRAARLMIATAGNPIYIQNGSFADNGAAAPFRADDEGLFEFPIQSGTWKLAVLGEEGYAELDGERFQSPQTIQLRPWGRVEGVLKIGSRLASHETISLETDESWYPGRPHIGKRYQATTDDNGRFALDRVPPGSFRVARYVQVGYNTYSYHQSQKIAVTEGGTIQVALGGRGRPVTGRVVMAAGQPSVDYTYGSNAIRSTARPGVRGIGQALADLAGGRRTDLQPQYFGFWIKPDGSFRVEDVPPGEYDVEVKAIRPGAEHWRPASVLAIGSGRFTMPNIDEAQRDTPLDIGTIEIDVPGGTTSPDAPDFEAISLDGKPIKLSEFRGKYVLLDFWATWGGSNQEAVNLKATRSAFVNDPRFAMIGMNLDKEPGAARVYIREQQLDWPQVHLGDKNTNPIAKRFGVTGVPTIWLIGPNGKVIAKDLRGDSIQRTVEAALGR